MFAFVVERVVLACAMRGSSFGGACGGGRLQKQRGDCSGVCRLLPASWQ